MRGLAVMFVAAAAAWAGARVYLQAEGMRSGPKIYREPVLNEIARFKPVWMYADRPVYSFWAGVPMPPPLGVVSLKRFWAGEITNDQLVEELTHYRPGVILLLNDGRAVPFQGLIEREYYLAYYDAEHRLYARKPVTGTPLGL